MAQAGEVEQVTTADELYRRLAPDHVKDGQVLSVAYKLRGKPDAQVSVAIARLTTPEEMLRDRPAHGLGVLLAQVPLSLGLAVRHEPVPELYAHALILNVGDRQRQREMCRRLAEATRILLPPRPM